MTMAIITMDNNNSDDNDNGKCVFIFNVCK